VLFALLSLVLRRLIQGHSHECSVPRDRIARTDDSPLRLDRLRGGLLNCRFRQYPVNAARISAPLRCGSGLCEDEPLLERTHASRDNAGVVLHPGALTDLGERRLNPGRRPVGTV
jgi:hypothetical protein